MTDTTAIVHPVESCNLGKLDHDRVVLRINFVMSESGGNNVLGHAVFGLSCEMADGLIKGLTAVLEGTPAPPKH